MFVTFSQKNLDDGYALIIIEPDDNEQFFGGEGIAISRAIATGEEYLGAEKGIWTGKKEILKVAGKLEKGRLVFRLEPYYVNNINKGGHCVYLFDKDGNEKDYPGDVFINGVRKSQILSEGFGLSEEAGAGPRDEAKEAFENVSQLVSESAAKIKEINLEINKTNNALLTLNDSFSSGNSAIIEHDYAALAGAIASLKQRKDELEKLAAGMRQGINNSKITSDSVMFPKAKAMVEESESQVQKLEAVFSDVLKKAEDVKPRFDAYQKQKADEAKRLQERKELERQEQERKELERQEQERKELERQEQERRQASSANLASGAASGSGEHSSSPSDGGSASSFSGSSEGAATDESREQSKSPVLFIILGVILLAGIAGAAWYFMNQSSANGTPEETKTESVNDDAAKAAEEAARAEAERKAAEEAEKAEAERRAAEEAERAEAERKAAEEAQKAEAERKAAEEAARKAAKGNVKSRVAEFLKSENKDSESAMELAEDLDPQTAQDQDLVFKLYYFAAMRDNEKGALRYAECLDPSKPTWGSIEKDPVEAWQYYGKSSDGKSMRQSMKDWVEQEASNGNSQAKKWLRKLK